jgi:ABC-type uncharacterized transport system permease subunit
VNAVRSWATRLALALAAPVLALVIAVAVTSLVLLISGYAPGETFRTMFEYAQRPRTQVGIINFAITYYFAAVAVAIGFRMNLFNIGVDGQYQLAALFAAYVGASVALPNVLHVGLIIVVAIVVGAAWALVAALLKVYRGVSEVISTIMLNYIVGGGIIAFLLTPGRFAQRVEGSNNVGTKPIPESGRVGGFDLIQGSSLQVYGLLWLAVVVGLGYWFLIDRTRFGFDLRSTGLSEPAAVASGVDVRRMVIYSMLLSGAVAGLVGMPLLLGGTSNNYSLNFPSGLGFTGIAIALIGRNHPIGIALGALLWSFLTQSSQILDLQGIAKEIVLITQGVAVLSVVVAYELVRRYRVAAQQRSVGRQLAEPPPSPPPGGSDHQPEGVPA